MIVYVEQSEDYQTVLYDMTPDEYGFKGTGENRIDFADWVSTSKAPEGSEILQCITGFSWEVKNASGGTGKISIKSIEFLDEAQNTIEPNTRPYFKDIDKTMLNVPENSTKMQRIPAQAMRAFRPSRVRGADPRPCPD